MRNFVLKSVLMLLSVAMFSLTSCQKDEDTGGGSKVTPKTTTHTLRFTSKSRHPYLLEIDNKSDVIQGKSWKDYKLETGIYTWKVTQQAGYLFYPTKRSGTVSLYKDEEVTFP